jgi:hypothetical protein
MLCQPYVKVTSANLDSDANHKVTENLDGSSVCSVWKNYSYSNAALIEVLHEAFSYGIPWRCR